MDWGIICRAFKIHILDWHREKAENTKEAIKNEMSFKDVAGVQREPHKNLTRLAKIVAWHCIIFVWFCFLYCKALKVTSFLNLKPNNLF